tara:strand:+ start:245 stop:751 length:507 start_codon:yes stop_codon:yes gene_type:complete
MSQLDWKNPAFLEQIKVERVEDYYKLSINGNPITFNTPLLRVPFGLDRKYNVIQIKLQCLTEEEDAEAFIEFLENLEEKLIELTGIPRNSFSSCITKNPKYPPLFTSKIVTNRGGIIGTEVINTKGEFQNLFNIEKGDHVKVRLFVDSIRPYSGRFWYKLKSKKIVCV